MQLNYKFKYTGQCGGIIIPVILFSILLLQTSCKKMVSIPEPVNSLTTTEVFSTDAEANSSLAGIYTQMINNSSPDFASGAMSIYCGLSSDELVDYNGTTDATGYQFNSNSLLSTNGVVSTNFWTNSYKFIYSANAIIEGLAASTGISDSVRKELTGEAKFIRAFCYFYLTNLFGDVPLALTSDWNQTYLMKRTSQADIYKQIEQDLTDAQTLLLSDYSVGGGERIRPNKWAATALLARVYLFEKKWADAETQATEVINSSQFNLVSSLANVFDANSNEAIWQLQQNNNYAPLFNATWDGRYLVPLRFLSSYPASTQATILANWSRQAYKFIPTCYPTSELVNAFESGDQRKSVWMDTTGTLPDGNIYYVRKYILSSTTTAPGGSIPQYYMVLRLAEQYLIRAEARAQLGESNAVDDLNAIRNRAGLANYAGATDQTSLLNAIYHERQVELFCEWGQRWFDLKRTGQAVQTLQSITLHAAINNNSLLFPIPYSELQKDPNLVQNEGY